MHKGKDPDGEWDEVWEEGKVPGPWEASWSLLPLSSLALLVVHHLRFWTQRWVRNFSISETEVGLFLTRLTISCGWPLMSHTGPKPIRPCTWEHPSSEAHEELHKGYFCTPFQTSTQVFCVQSSIFQVRKLRLRGVLPCHRPGSQ